MAKFEVVPLAELKTSIPAELLPLVEAHRGYLGKLRSNQGGRLTLEKGDDPKNVRKALKVAAASLNKQVRFPFRGEKDAVSFYLEGQVERRGRRSKAGTKGLVLPRAKPGGKKRGRPKKER